MRQRRWLELIKDYDLDIVYHPGKANVVADALSRRGHQEATVARLTVQPSLQTELILRGIEVWSQRESGHLTFLEVQSELTEEIRRCQADCPEIADLRERMAQGRFRDLSEREDGMLMFQDRVVVPSTQELRQRIMREAHSTPYSVHPGSNKMYQDLRRAYWWQRMRADIAEFVARCQICQQVRIEHQRPGGLVRSLPVPEWKWTDISMDFVTGLRRDVRGFDAIWVVVDRLTKSAHFIPIQETWPVSTLAQEFIRQIVRLHGVPERIVSDRDGRFTSRFWRQVHEALGSRLQFSTSYHPQTDGQSERTIQTLEDMLRACVLEWGDRWVRFLPLVEFSYNNSYHASIDMAPYQALYGRRCKSPLCWDDPADTVATLPEMVRETVDQIGRI
jgi:hypothetical protein